MSYMLFEVWAEDETGQPELIDTTASQKEAFDLAKQSLEEGYLAVAVYQENEEGDSVLIKEFQNTPT